MRILTKRSDVCKKIGVTRRKLQWYNQIDLLSPSYIDESSGFWYYDNDAIMKLKVIEVLHELNYKNDKIKEIINTNKKDINKELDNVIDGLIKKKEKIDGQIILIKTLKNNDLIFNDLPEYIIELVNEFDILPLFYELSQERVFINDFTEDANTLGKLKNSFDYDDINLSDNDISNLVNYNVEIYFILVVLTGLYKLISPYDHRVQKCIDYLFNIKIPDSTTDDNEDINEELSNKIEYIKTFIFDESISKSLCQKKGEEVRNYMIEAIDYYLNHNSDIYK